VLDTQSGASRIRQALALQHTSFARYPVAYVDPSTLPELFMFKEDLDSWPTAQTGRPAWIADVLALTSQGKPRKAMALLMRTLEAMIGSSEFAACDRALRLLPVAELTPSLLVGALTITAPHRDSLAERAHLVERTRERLQREMPDRVDRVLAGLD